MNYFEIEFSSEDDCNERLICIRGTDRPTVAEAQQFCAADSKAFGLPVTGVYPIDEATARACYDFQNENTWPIFSKPAKGLLVRLERTLMGRKSKL